ncbi:TetR/AcrR family transcriptional regulator C-terminal domain-containing protein [Nonomuraea indica]|uniref:TetR/AcrR family transcriptional regulator C-terminal domain-containing protein n=1 Tax=Nonomuraea indica TaxID=1581193 RepID=UPI001C5EE844|nr:TetR/AcrR family transcriptional regulator C-terminal domain-containing protein [Nonomuraea indica]
MTANRGRGQRAGLTRQAILRAAVRLADQEGLTALSMRRIAAELGVEAMTLYHHVPNKNALLDGIVEQLVSETTPPPTASSWQESLRAYAHAFLATLTAHPNLIALVATRPATTPHNLRTMEAMLESLRSAGFELTRAHDVVRSLAAFVLGHAAAHPDLAPDCPPVDAGSYPLFFAAVATSDAASRFDFALEALLHGFAAALTAAPSGGRPGAAREAGSGVRQDCAGPG